MSFKAGLLALVLALYGVAAHADGALERVRAAGSVLVGVDAPYGVMEYFDEAGVLQGVDADVARALGTGIGVDTKFKTMAFSELFDALKAGRVDLVISAVTITEERQKSMRFSAPYFDAALSMAVREDDSTIASLEDLATKRVGVLGGTTGEAFARKSALIDNAKIVVFKDNEKRVSALMSGTVDAIVMHFSPGLYEGLRILEEPISQSYYGVVGRMEDVTLMRAVDAELRAMKRSGALKRIRERHLN